MDGWFHVVRTGGRDGRRRWMSRYGCTRLLAAVRPGRDKPYAATVFNRFSFPLYIIYFTRAELAPERRSVHADAVALALRSRSVRYFAEISSLG